MSTQGIVIILLGLVLLLILCSMKKERYQTFPSQWLVKGSYGTDFNGSIKDQSYLGKVVDPEKEIPEKGLYSSPGPYQSVLNTCYDVNLDKCTSHCRRSECFQDCQVRVASICS